MDWLMFVLQIAFWLPMVQRLATREAPPTTFGDELKSSLRSPRMVLYELGVILVWIGLGVRFWPGAMDRHVTAAGLAGTAFHLVAIALMAWAFSVHRSWNIEARLEAEHQLCTTGPYGLVRHPIYLAFDLQALGASIWVPHPLVLVGTVLLVVAGDLRARAEEVLLVGAFGDRYRAYMRRVRRTIPGLY